MNTVSKSWLRISPAFCMRLSSEYPAGKTRAGRNSCNGSTKKLSAAAETMMAALAQSSRSKFLGATFIRT